MLLNYRKDKERVLTSDEVDMNFSQIASSVTVHSFSKIENEFSPLVDVKLLSDETFITVKVIAHDDENVVINKYLVYRYFLDGLSPSLEFLSEYSSPVVEVLLDISTFYNVSESEILSYFKLNFESESDLEFLCTIQYYTPLEFDILMSASN